MSPPRRRPPTTRILERRERPTSRRIPSYRLRLLGDGDAVEKHVRTALFRVGSAPGNDWVLDESTVSRLHFELLVEDDGVRLRDLGSSNGTWVDGQRAYDLVLKPGSEIRVGRARIRFEPDRESTEVPLFPEGRFGPLVGESPVMRALFAQLDKVARSEATVLVEGETGVGKELVAEAIHETSPRSRGPFVVFDCAAAPAGLLESELFGHEKGAFTGAHEARRGLLEEAEGGTLLLDELGELPLSLQPKLLRAIERRELRPLGARRARRFDARFVAATHRDLAAEVNRGGFREDLYYRLAVVRLRVPPLRERPEDIPLLVEHFAHRLARDTDTAHAFLDRFRPEDWESLRGYPFPGNVRELRNLVERGLAFGAPASPADPEPPTPLATSRTAEAEMRVDLDRPFREQKEAVLRAFERAYLLGILDRHGGNISRAAAAAGLDRMYFKRLLRRYR